MQKFLLLFIISLFLIVSCGPNKPQGLTSDVIEKEKQEVLDVIKNYNQAYANKDFAGLVDYMSQDVIFFGTDSSEVITSLAEYKNAMQKQWELYDTMKYGDMVDEFVQMDRNATLASVIYGSSLELITTDGEDIRYFVRVSRTLKKENNQWLIVTGLVGIATTQQSADDLLQSAEAEKSNELQQNEETTK